jgi:hypothetical protein
MILKSNLFRLVKKNDSNGSKTEFMFSKCKFVTFIEVALRKKTLSLWLR